MHPLTAPYTRRLAPPSHCVTGTSGYATNRATSTRIKRKQEPRGRS